jgi:glycosyltransferase involved in cell wall biosynthesis
MTTDVPLVSVIIPTYNRINLLDEALASVAAQSLTPYEVIVVDDASTEDVVRKVSDFGMLPISLIRRPVRGGAAAARNTGILEAKGEYLGFLDSDDLWRPDKIEKQTAYHATNSDILLSCTGYAILRMDGKESMVTYETKNYSLPELAFGCSLSPGSTLFVKRSIFEEVGMFDETLPRLEDWDWLIRAVAVSRIGLMPQILATIQQTGFAPYDSVKIAVEQVGSQHRKLFAQCSVKAGLQFRAALANEMAVANFRRHSFLAAFIWLLRSLFIYPFRQPNYYLRVLSGALRTLAERSA